MGSDDEAALKARVDEAERRYLDGEELNDVDRRILAYSLHKGGCHACGGR